MLVSSCLPSGLSSIETFGLVTTAEVHTDMRAALLGVYVYVLIPNTCCCTFSFACSRSDELICTLSSLTNVTGFLWHKWALAIHEIRKYQTECRFTLPVAHYNSTVNHLEDAISWRIFNFIICKCFESARISYVFALTSVGTNIVATILPRVKAENINAICDPIP